MALAIGFLFNNKDERPIFVATALGIGVNFVFLILLALLWASNGFEPVYYQGPVLYHQAATEFSIGLFLDAYSLVYLPTATFLTGVVVTFSRYYIHRVRGY